MLPPPPPPPQGRWASLLVTAHFSEDMKVSASQLAQHPELQLRPRALSALPPARSRPAPGSSCCPPPSSPARALSQTHTQISPGFKKRKPRMPWAIRLWPLCVPRLPSQAALSLVSTGPGPSGVDAASGIPGDQHPSRWQDRPHPFLTLPKTETLHHLSPWHRSKH